MNKIYRNTYAEINLENIYQNYLSVKRLVKNKKVIPVVKANAYGHGVIEVVKYFIDKDVDYFAVSLLEEALELRQFFVNINILVMGVVQKDFFHIAASNNITLSLSNSSQLIGIELFSEDIKFHIKVDTGMNRLGFKDLSEIFHTINVLKSNKNIHLEGIFTHFATSDCDKEYYDSQLNRFENILHSLDYKFDFVHASNSSSAIKYESNIDFTTHVRLGISLYGLSLDDNMDFLKNTFKFVTHISEIKYLKSGDKVGYGATYTASKDEIIGILPVGYADGFIRKNQSGDVEINGKRYPIIGRICMDQMFIRINEEQSIDDKVILFGGIVSIDEVAKRLNTINYEIICQITNRVPRIYV